MPCQGSTLGVLHVRAFPKPPHASVLDEAYLNLK